ncbi:hypothetical protein ACLOJK_016386 [Asimina triloba]
MSRSNVDFENIAKFIFTQKTIMQLDDWIGLDLGVPHLEWKTDGLPQPSGFCTREAFSYEVYKAANGGTLHYFPKKPNFPKQVGNLPAFSSLKPSPSSFISLSLSFSVSLGEEKSEKGAWPAWLKSLLGTTFFTPCKFHSDSFKNECNMYCLVCMNGGLCSSCLVSHRDHHVIQIRRSSYHDVIRVSEIQRVLDISGVQTYVINSAKVVFLNERPQPRPGKGGVNSCKVCDRSLLDSFSFCSLGCKLAAGCASSPARHRRKAMAEQSSPDSHDSWPPSHPRNGEKSSQLCISPPPTPPPGIVNYRTVNRRKGIPHRAPMGIC